MLFLPWRSTKMGVSNCRNLLSFLIGLACFGLVCPMTLSKADHQMANQLTEKTPKLSSMSPIQVACPMPETYCVPRTRCAFRSVVYDREGLRFMQGTDMFEDKYGCGVFQPTETYVCCESKELLEPHLAWVPTSSQWFVPLEGASQQPRSAQSSAHVPKLSPWPAFEEVEELRAEADELDILSEVHVNDGSGQEPKRLSQEYDELASAENVEVKGPSEDISHQTESPQDNVAPPSVPFMHEPLDPRLFNPWSMPMLGMTGQPPMLPTIPNFNSMFFANPAPGLPATSRFSPPRSDWVEMILIFPDGSVQHTIKEQRASSFTPTTEQPPRMSVEIPHTHATGSSTPTMQPLEEAESSTKKSSVTEANTRGRRAIETKTFKVEPARGGLWLGNVTFAEDVREGRALVPPPKAIWGLPGSGNVPVLPMSAAFNVNGDSCGVSSTSGINARVLSGRQPGSEFDAEANMAEFPWHVGIINGETGNYLCGGAIVSGRFVVTVAHCVRRYQLSLLFVRVGDWDLSVTSEMFPSYDVEVLKVIVHEDYNAGNMQNDIALLQLKYPLDFAAMPHVGSICLPPSGEQLYTDCIVTGWGQQVATTEGKADVTKFSRTLRKTSQTLVTHQFCERSLRPYLGQFYQLPMKGFVCAYDKDGKDSCFGDGGGALACLVNNPNYGKSDQYHAIGLVSWGVGCGIPGVPAVYTNLMHYRDWIHAKIFPVDPYAIDGGKEFSQPALSLNPAIMLRTGKEIDENLVEESEFSSREKDDPFLTRDFIDLAFN